MASVNDNKLVFEDFDQFLQIALEVGFAVVTRKRNFCECLK